MICLNQDPEGQIKPLKERPDAIPENAWELLVANNAKIWSVGSQTIEGASTPDSDHDFLVFTWSPIPHVYSSIGCDLEWGSEHYEPSNGKFNSWRSNDVNFIATYDTHFCRNFLIANSVAQKLGLKSRDDRVALFQAVLYRNAPVALPDPLFVKTYADLDAEIPF